ncbi:MAG: glycosyltransferase family 2 protein [Ferruginibacter sp.]|nr:glycosyltransferase family 2 protein [Ferruginibacter sp.]
MERTILFSVVIPTYNRAAFVLKTIQTFLQQTYTNFEIIVVDDGSKDNTEEMVKDIVDPRFRYYKKENGERGAARNYGLSHAQGTYVNFFDSDDTAYPNHLAVAAEVIKMKQLPEIFNLAYDIKAPDGKLLSVHDHYDGNVEAYAVKTKRVSINALFVKTEVARAVKFSENRLLSASEDALFLCQLCARHLLHYDNTITSTIIEHDSRSMVIATEQQLKNRQQLMIEGLWGDLIFMKKYRHTVPAIDREFNYLLCLSSLANKENKKAADYFRNYLSGQPSNLFSQRTLVFLKKYVVNLI